MASDLDGLEEKVEIIYREGEQIKTEVIQVSPQSGASVGVSK